MPYPELCPDFSLRMNSDALALRSHFCLSRNSFPLISLDAGIRLIRRKGEDPRLTESFSYYLAYSKRDNNGTKLLE